MIGPGDIKINRMFLPLKSMYYSGGKTTNRNLKGAKTLNLSFLN